ncbi:MAG: hypothetical protein AAGF84_05820 [Planctomycetota bacterium]
MSAALDPEDAASWSAWASAAKKSAIDASLRELYEHIEAAIAERGPTCWQSGKCCNFGAYGHRLYVTALEVAWFLGQAQRFPKTVATQGDIALPQASSDDTCPFQIDRACSTHRIRPLGCRVFFCQEGTQSWQQALYEKFLRRLRDIHRTHDVEYRYADWLALLDEAERSGAIERAL